MDQIAQKQDVTVRAKLFEALGNGQKIAVVAVQIGSNQELSVPGKAK